MFKYIIKRILIFIPTLLVISLMTFLLSQCAPGDPVIEKLPPLDEFNGKGLSYQKLYNNTAKEMGYAKPVFYCTFTSAAYPDTLHQVLFPSERETLVRLTNRYGNWENVSSYYYFIEQVTKNLAQFPDTLAPDLKIEVSRNINQLVFQYEEKAIEKKLEVVEGLLKQHPQLSATCLASVVQLGKRYNQMKENPSPLNAWIPKLYWHGTNNQYHHWLSNFIRGDFGKSYSDQRPVSFKIKNAIWWTLIINVVSIAIIFLLAIPIGIIAARKKGQRFDRYTTVILFILFSLPSFWVATLLVVFFTTPEYGMKLFESIGLGDLPPSAPFAERFMEKSRHLILPIFCNSFNSLAFVSRQMRGGMLDVLEQDYIRTARAKGLKERIVVWKHALRNSLFPLITMFAVVFPAAIGGSVVIEVIFNIPGMGRLILSSILSSDWPVVYTIMMLGAVMTLIGNLFADILYAYANPRVKFSTT